MFNRPIVSPVPAAQARSEQRAAVAWQGQAVLDGLAHVLRVLVPVLPHMDTQQSLQWRATVVFQSLQGDGWRMGLRLLNPTPADHELRQAWVKRSRRKWSDWLRARAANPQRSPKL